MGFQERNQAGEIIRAVAVRITEQGGGEGPVFPCARAAADRPQRLFEYICAGYLLHGRLGLILQRGLRECEFRQGPIGLDDRLRMSGRGRHEQGQNEQKLLHGAFWSRTSTGMVRMQNGLTAMVLLEKIGMVTHRTLGRAQDAGQTCAVR